MIIFILFLRSAQTKCLILIRSNSSPTILNNLESVLDEQIIQHFESSVKSNVAIAAAITAYARIHMLQFKIPGQILYTSHLVEESEDTDSIITNTPLNPSLVGTELRLMKELRK